MKTALLRFNRYIVECKFAKTNDIILALFDLIDT